MKDNRTPEEKRAEYQEALDDLEKAVDELKEACVELGIVLKVEIAEPVGKLLDGIVNKFKQD